MRDLQGDQAFEVVIVKYGTRTTRRSEVFLNYPLYGESDGDIEVGYYFWVLRGADSTIVVDTGFGAGPGAKRGRTMLIHPLDALAALGVDPAKVPAVVVTHAHYDHIGNLAAFTSAQVIVSRSELEFWSGSHSRHLLFSSLVEENELDGLRAAAESGRLVAFDNVHTLPGGVELLRVGGHTPGQTMVKVPTNQGTVLLTSDAVHFQEELDRYMPFAFVADLPGTYAGFDLIGALAANGEVTHVVTGHDPLTLERFTPVDGALRGLAATIGAQAA